MFYKENDFFLALIEKSKLIFFFKSEKHDIKIYITFLRHQNSRESSKTIRTKQKVENRIIMEF